MNKLLHQTKYAMATLLVASFGVLPAAQAEMLVSSHTPTPVVASTEGYAMVGWLTSLGIVEQVQMIHRLGQSTSPAAIKDLITALSSQFPLARRKASRSLLEKAGQVDGEDRLMLAMAVKPALNSQDPVVQRNIVRLMADIHTPESEQSLQQFFKGSDKEAQLNAVDALLDHKETHRSTLELVKQVTPYSEVRQAAVNSLI